jgi:hypothetical protein
MTLSLTDEQRTRGIHVVAGKGSGKTRLLASLAMQDAVRGLPVVGMDRGPLIDAILNTICRLSPEKRAALLKRVVLIDMAGGEYIVPLPFYVRLGDETAFDIAERFPDIVERIDPALNEAPVQGMNPLRRDAREGGIALVNKGHQITELPEGKSPSLPIKLQPFKLDENMRAIYGGSSGLDWEQVVAERKIVLFDYRHVRGKEKLRLAYTWVFHFFLAFIEERGIGHTPISFVLDELAVMQASQRGSGRDYFAEDMDKLVNFTMRQHNLWVTVAHQTMTQFGDSPWLQSILLNDMDTQIAGIEKGGEPAKMLADRFFQYDLEKVRRIRERLERRMFQLAGGLGTAYEASRNTYDLVADPIYATISEQLYENREHFRKLRQFEFLVKVDLDPPKHISIANMPPKFGWNTKLLAPLRAALIKKSGRPRADILAEIEARTQANRHGPEISGSSNQPEQQPLPGIPEQPKKLPVRKGGGKKV